MSSTSTDYVCDLDVDGWQLYSYDYGDGGEEERKKRARVKRRAASLSKRLTKLVAEAKEKLAADPLLSERKLALEVRDKMYKLMSKYSDDGARDTEPEGVLCDELERAFSLERYSVERW